MKFNKHQLILGLVALSSSSAFAAGFQLQEQNITNMGSAFSGTAASSDNASQNFYNVASMTHTPCTNVSLAAVSILTSGKVTTTSATSNSGAAVTDNNIDHPGTFTELPSFGVAHRLSNHWFLGFNVATPFGLQTQYGETKNVRYVATRSELQTFDFSPALAYRFNKHWGAGVGYNATFVRAHLDASLAGASPNGNTDGYVKNEGSDWASSWKIGLLYDLNDATRFGLQYRSKMDVGIRNGKSNQVNPVSLGGDGTTITQSLFNADIVLPETATLSVRHKASHRWTILGDVSWTNWNRFKNLALVFQPNGNTIANVNEHWKDSWRVAAGLEHNYSERWTLRFGGAYDASPVDDKHRTARIPDNDRIWAGVGATYHVNNHVSIDGGYDHIFIKKAMFNDLGPVGATGARVSDASAAGESKGNGDVFGLQLNVSY